MKCGLDELAVRWIENWTSGQARRNSSGRALCVPPGSVVDPVLFSIFIDALDIGAEWVHPQQIGRWLLTGKSAWCTRGLCCSAEGHWQAGERVYRNLMKFSKVKCKVLHLDRSNSRQQCMPGATQLENCFEQQDLKVLPGGRQAEHEPAMCTCGKEG